MKIGYFSTLSSEGISPGELARELEARGYDSMWLPEHSHIPVHRKPTAAFGEHVPEAYLHLLDPFVSLAAAAEATSSLLLGLGVSMVLEHDVIDLAKRVATLDLLSGGRLRFGVGAGWLPEELAVHRPDVPFGQRYAAVLERVAALRVLWVEEEPVFEGRWDRFPPVWVHPKPVQRPLPIGFGFSGPKGLEWAAQHADEWYPIDAALANAFGGVSTAIDRFREAVSRHGRDPEAVPVTLVLWGWDSGTPSSAYIESLGQLTIERVVIAPPTMERHGASTTLRRLDEYQHLLT